MASVYDRESEADDPAKRRWDTAAKNTVADQDAAIAYEVLNLSVAAGRALRRRPRLVFGFGVMGWTVLAGICAGLIVRAFRAGATSAGWPASGTVVIALLVITWLAIPVLGWGALRRRGAL